MFISFSPALCVLLLAFGASQVLTAPAPIPQREPTTPAETGGRPLEGRAATTLEIKSSLLSTTAAKSTTKASSINDVPQVTTKIPVVSSTSKSTIKSTVTGTGTAATATATTNSNPGDDQKNPILRAFDASNTDGEYAGIQELYEADCYSHLCQAQPVTMNHWDQSKHNRDADTGNGAVPNQIFANLKKSSTTRPGDDYVSPEEWPPASVAQGGRTATLVPVTVAAQGRKLTALSRFVWDSLTIFLQTGQAPLLNAFFAKKVNGVSIGQQIGLDGYSKGSWFRINEWTGATGPYCKKLNTLLNSFSSNFDGAGVIKSKPDICTEKKLNMNGLAYDPGEYAYEYDGKKYKYVGK